MSLYIIAACFLLMAQGLMSEEYCNSGYPGYKYTRCAGYCCKEESDGCCEDMADIPLIVGCVMANIVLLAVIVTVVVIICHKKVKGGRVIHAHPHTHNALMFTSAQLVPQTTFYIGPPPPYPGSPSMAHAQECINENFRNENATQNQHQYHQQPSQIQHQCQQPEPQPSDACNHQQQHQWQQLEHYTIFSDAYSRQRTNACSFLPNHVTFLPNEDPPPYSASIVPDRR